MPACSHIIADIQTYTALMQEDEVKANSFREKLKRNLNHEVLHHNGRILKLSGDGALWSFNSAIEAVRAAVGIEKAKIEEPKSSDAYGMINILDR